MKARFFKGQRGLSLIELAVIMAIMGVLAAIVVPNVGGFFVGGFFSAGQSQSYIGDQQTLQTAVNGFRTDSSNVGNKNPTEANFKSKADATKNCGGTGIGTPSATCASYMDLNVLVNGSDPIPGAYIQGTDSVKSADKTKNTTATQAISGSYGWYVNDKGVVNSTFGATNLADFQETYP
ncbi:MAG: prepilin-type N-terminal cleavage/methylation domain-containing protein [Dehalococcoidia bacterium]|nr:prepilin-type N-terminal cleavage/methylation domain-containing protein [Dehalococcoidia bacterium]